MRNENDGELIGEFLEVIAGQAAQDVRRRSGIDAQTIAHWRAGDVHHIARRTRQKLEAFLLRVSSHSDLRVSGQPWTSFQLRR